MTSRKDRDKNSPNQDEKWFEVLAGRKVKDLEPKIQREAEELRKVILQKNKRELGNNNVIQDEVTEASSIKKLLVRLKQEGLLDDANTQLKSKWLKKVSAVAAVLFLTIGVFTLIPLDQESLLPQTSPDFSEPRVRSGIEAQTIQVKDNKHSIKVAHQLIKQLKELNIPYRLIPQGESNKPQWQLEIYIPFDPSEPILTFLAKWHLTTTDNGWIKIVPVES